MLPTPSEPAYDDDDIEDELGGGFDQLTDADQALLRAAEKTSDFETTPKKALPQPEKGTSMPDLPKVKASSFKRVLK